MSGLTGNPFLLASAAGGAAGYTISRSLRFNSSDSAYLSRTPSTAGNRKTWSFSAWVKRTAVATQHAIFSIDSGLVAGAIQFGFLSDGRFFCDRYTVSTFTSAAVFRDPSAWYHLLISCDTTRASGRIKAYINNSEVFSDNCGLSQNDDTSINQASSHVIGRNINSGSYFDGYLADIHFIDGQALDPSSFTEVSATTGQLIPKAYTGSFGTNGFWLKFSDNSAATATTLGKDYSGNSNNWTPNNLSVAGGANTITTPATNAPPTVDYLVIGGGGGGGSSAGGGGGSGGFLSGTGFSVAAGTSYSVQVGSGGSGAPASLSVTAGLNGESSVFSSLSALGGGGGGSRYTNTAPTSGGSGGGGYGDYIGTSSGASGTAGQGNAGGSGLNGSGYGSGGGGGAGSVGATATTNQSGAGGSGSTSSITGSAVTYAGGGGGGGSANGALAGSGGTGGGAAGGPYQTNGSSASANTGGGGGGAGGTSTTNYRTGGNGGSGIVVIRYSNTYADLSIGVDLTYTYSNAGGYKIYSFTASTTSAQAAGNDSLVDTPTSGSQVDTGLGGQVTGNYCTLNPIAVSSQGRATLSNGNLDINYSDGGNYFGALSTFALATGKWYWEYTNTTNGSANGTGIIPTASIRGAVSANYGFAEVADSRYRANTYVQGNASNLVTGLSTLASGDVIGVAVDFDAGKIWFSRNGTWESSGNPAAGTSATSTFTAGREYYMMAQGYGTWAGSFNAGQRPFAYTAPSGFKALCTANLPSTTITTSGSYTGNGVADGPFVYLNGVPTAMTVNGNAVTFGTHADKLSNGFKIRTTSTTYNQNASTYNYTITTTGDPFKRARAQTNP